MKFYHPEIRKWLPGASEDSVVLNPYFMDRRRDLLEMQERLIRILPCTVV